MQIYNWNMKLISSETEQQTCSAAANIRNSFYNWLLTYSTTLSLD